MRTVLTESTELNTSSRLAVCWERELIEFNLLPEGGLEEQPIPAEILRDMVYMVFPNTRI